MCNKTINHAAADDELFALVRLKGGRAGGTAAVLDVKLALVPPFLRSFVAINRKVTNDDATEADADGRARRMTWQRTRDKV